MNVTRKMLSVNNKDTLHDYLFPKRFIKYMKQQRQQKSQWSWLYCSTLSRWSKWCEFRRSTGQILLNSLGIKVKNEVKTDSNKISFTLMDVSRIQGSKELMLSGVWYLLISGTSVIARNSGKHIKNCLECRKKYLSPRKLHFR